VQAGKAATRTVQRRTGRIKCHLIRLI